MKAWKQRLAILLLFPALLAYLPLTAQAHSFTDVSGSAYRDAISYVYDNGIMDGVTTTAFAPGNAVNRAMFVTILYRFAGEPQNFADVNFTDVPEGRYFTDAVRWGVYEGIITGTSATTFSPYSTLQKQQVVTFLYRFAKYRGYSVPTSGSLTCSDASKIFNYAKVPMYWAVQNGVLDDLNVQEPTKGSTRGEAAQYICRFGTNVDGLLKGKDTFSFANELSNFKFRDYYGISESHYDLLTCYASSDKREIDYVLSTVYNPFPMYNNGSCYGISLCVILDKLGKIDFNGSFCNNVDTMYQVPKPTDTSSKTIWRIEKKNNSSISLTESAINYYQAASAAVETLGTDCKEHHSISNRWGRDTLQDLVNGQRHGGLGLFCYVATDASGADICHAIVIYGKPSVGVSSYVYDAYDNRYPNNTATVTVAKDYTTCSVLPAAGKRETVTEVYYLNDFSVYDAVDIDGPRNADSNTVRSMDEMPIPPGENEAEPSILDGGYTVLYIDTDSDFTVTNAEGETLEFIDHTYSGTMWAQYLRMIPMGGHALRMILVQDSAQFDFTTTGSCQYLGITSQNLSQSVSGVPIDQVTLGTSGASISGTEMTYCLSHTLGDYSVRLTGHGESQITTHTIEQGLEVQAELAAYTVEFSKTGEISGWQSNMFQADETARITEQEVGISVVVAPETEVIS